MPASAHPGDRSAARRCLNPLAMLAILLWLLVGTAAAQELQAIPELRERVTDLSSTLDERARAALAERLTAIEVKSGSQVAILLIPSTMPEPIEAYAIRVADAWKLGRKDVDDGVLILVAKADRRMRIEVGRGLEGAIPDAIAKRIIAERMAPAFRQGDYAGGLRAAVEAIALRIDGEQLPAPTDGGNSADGVGGEELFVIGMIASIFLGSILKAVLGRLLGSAVSAGLVGAAAWVITGTLFIGLIAAVLALIFILSMGSGGGGFGGGGRGGRGGPWMGGGGGSMRGSGGWSGGGGGFGGGGASGGW